MFLLTFEPAATFGAQVKAEYRRRRFDQIRQPIVLGDGAKWIWAIADQHFPAATEIGLTHLHAREHLADLTRILTPDPDRSHQVRADPHRPPRPRRHRPDRRHRRRPRPTRPRAGTGPAPAADRGRLLHRQPPPHAIRRLQSQRLLHRRWCSSKPPATPSSNNAPNEPACTGPSAASTPSSPYAPSTSPARTTKPRGSTTNLTHTRPAVFFVTVGGRPEVGSMAEILLFHHAQGQTPASTPSPRAPGRGAHGAHAGRLRRTHLRRPSTRHGHARRDRLRRGLRARRHAADGLPEGLALRQASRWGDARAEPGPDRREPGGPAAGGLRPDLGVGSGWPDGVPVQVHGMDGDPYFAEEGGDIDAARAPRRRRRKTPSCPLPRWTSTCSPTVSLAVIRPGAPRAPDPAGAPLSPPPARTMRPAARTSGSGA